MPWFEARRSAALLLVCSSISVLWVSALLVACGGGSDAIEAPAATASGGSAAPGGRSSPSTGTTDATTAATVTPRSADYAAAVAGRPYTLVEPDDLDRDEAAPLLLVLHPYGREGSVDDYFGIDAVARADSALIAYPVGTVDSSGRHFWNATDVCCDFDNSGVDDVAYLSAVIDDIASKHRVDAKRVYVLGQSNGAFMGHRLACDLADRIAAVVATSGTNWAGNQRCQPSEPIAMLQVQGDADELVLYEGGRLPFGPLIFPSAADSIAGWASRNGCDPTASEPEGELDIVSNLAGEETSIARFEDCDAGGAAELWTVHGGRHTMQFTPTFAPAAWAFLEGHARP